MEDEFEDIPDTVIWTWGRLLVYPTWRWWPKVSRGGDEWHNPSVLFTTPIGSVAVFYGKGFSRSGLEHFSSAVAGVPEGFVAPGCPDCEEFLEALCPAS